MTVARRPLVAGNWKMNGLRRSASELRAMIADAGDVAAKTDLLVCPPATLVAEFAALARGSAVRVGAQDCHAESSGGFLFTHRSDSGWLPPGISNRVI